MINWYIVWPMECLHMSSYTGVRPFKNGLIFFWHTLFRFVSVQVCCIAELQLEFNIRRHQRHHHNISLLWNSLWPSWLDQYTVPTQLQEIPWPMSKILPDTTYMVSATLPLWFIHIYASTFDYKINRNPIKIIQNNASSCLKQHYSSSCWVWWYILFFPDLLNSLIFPDSPSLSRSVGTMQ